MPAQLRDIKVDFVSLVDRAAVRDPQNKSEPRRFLLFKREGTTEPPTAQGGDHMSAGTEADALQKAEDDIAAVIEKAKADGVDVSKLQARGDGPAKGDEPKDKDGVATPKEPTGKSTSNGEGSDNAGNISKADLSPEARAMVEKAEADANARIEKAEKAASEAGEIAKAERDLRVEREFIVKAQGFEKLPADARQLGAVLKRASEKLSKEDFDYVETLLKSADEAITQGDLFKEMGRGGVQDGATASDAYGQLEKKAEEIRKSDSKISQGDAIAKAMTENPELERQYLTEQRGSVR